MGRLSYWGVAGCLVVSGVVAFGSPAMAQSARGPQGCRKATFTADGGYYSMGQFYSEPGDDLTVVTRWCYSHNRITRQSVKYTTTIPGNLMPQISTHDYFADNKSVLNVLVVGTYNSNVVNNTGDIGVSGRVTATGRHHFVNASGAGG